MAGFDVDFNFQPKGSPPSGYVADYGKGFTTQGEYAFGWNVDNSKRMIDRKTAAAVRLDTFALLGDSKSAKTWEVEVPNGLYNVRVTSGDATLTNSRYGIDVEGKTLLDRTPTKATRWRTGEGLVWVGDGRLTVTSAADAYNNKLTNINITQVDPHVTGQDIVNPYASAGMVQNETPLRTALPALNALGTKSVRLWYDVKDWKDGPDQTFFDYFKAHKDAGYHVMVIFDTPSVPRAKDVKAFFQRIVAHEGATDMIDMWQIGNEMNVETYWTGTQQEYVERVLRPAYEVIHPTGEPVVGGGISFDVSKCVELESYGYSDYVDYSAFHPYGESADIVLQRATDAKAAFGGKPMIVSEWNVQGLKWTPEAWAQELAEAGESLKQIAYLNYYYALRTDNSHVGTGGAIFNSGKRNTLFWNVIEGWSGDDLA